MKENVKYYREERGRGLFCWCILNQPTQPECRRCDLGLLAPRLTLFLPCLGIALVGRSRPYALVAALFTFLHTWHGIQNLG